MNINIQSVQTPVTTEAYKPSDTSHKVYKRSIPQQLDKRSDFMNMSTIFLLYPVIHDIWISKVSSSFRLQWQLTHINSNLPINATDWCISKELSLRKSKCTRPQIVKNKHLNGRISNSIFYQFKNRHVQHSNLMMYLNIMSLEFRWTIIY